MNISLSKSLRGKRDVCEETFLFWILCREGRYTAALRYIWSDVTHYDDLIYTALVICQLVSCVTRRVLYEGYYF